MLAGVSRSVVATTAVAFSGCGWLFPFHVGAAYTLQQFGVIQPSTVLAGASGGAIAAAMLFTGISKHTAMQVLCDLSGNGVRFGEVDQLLRPVLYEFLPEDIVQRTHGKLRVAVTSIGFYGMRCNLVSEFTTKADLISALLTSCHIPYYTSKQFATRFRGDLHLDGGALNLLPPVRGVSVTPLPASIAFPFRAVDISADSVSGFPFTLAQLLRYVLRPGPPDVLHELCRCGEVAAAAYIKRRI